MKVTHDLEQNRFLITTDTEPAILRYRFLSPNEIDFISTYVPDSQRGKGIAEALVRAGLTWAKEQNLTIRASCWYVQKFL